tara:strand:+ start:76347 stop:77324 length:978 start_codon:yes stop_codon:yes gene_type:complete
MQWSAVKAMADEEELGCQRYVDMWALPGIHPSNVEFLQKLKTADTQHFTTHMDCVGTVSEHDCEANKWRKSHLIGIRTDVWKPGKDELADTLDALQGKRKQELKKSIKRSGRLNSKQAAKLDAELAQDDVMNMKPGDIERRRLVLKLFRTTSQRVSWAGTIEQVTTTEIHNSIGSKRSLLTMVVTLPRTEFVTYVQQNHRTFRIPPIFTFGFYDGQQMWNLSLKRRWVSIGADFDIEANGESIGEVDGRLFCMGSDSYVDLDAHPLGKCRQFVDLVTLFAASVGYHKAMRRSVKKRVKAACDGNVHCHIIEDEELRLHHNGRAAA